MNSKSLIDRLNVEPGCRQALEYLTAMYERVHAETGTGRVERILQVGPKEYHCYIGSGSDRVVRCRWSANKNPERMSGWVLETQRSTPGKFRGAWYGTICHEEDGTETQLTAVDWESRRVAEGAI